MIIEWLANILLVAGMWLIGRKWRPAFILTGVGEIVWVGTSIYQQLWPLAFICTVFAVLQFRSYYLWRPKTDHDKLYALLNEFGYRHANIYDRRAKGTYTTRDDIMGCPVIDIYDGRGGVSFYFDENGKYRNFQR